jgi:hypothetical protein
MSEAPSTPIAALLLTSLPHIFRVLCDLVFEICHGDANWRRRHRYFEATINSWLAYIPVLRMTISFSAGLSNHAADR